MVLFSRCPTCYMPHKSEIIHGINSTRTMKCHQSALTEKIYCNLNSVTVQQYIKVSQSEQ